MYGVLISAKETTIEITQKIYMCILTNIHGIYYCYFIFFRLLNGHVDCNGEFMSPRKTVIRRHLIEQHSGYGYKCRGCFIIFVRAYQQHKGCKYPNGDACDLTVRLTGEDVEEGFKKFTESVDSKKIEHKTAPQTPRGLTKTVKKDCSEPGFKKPKMPKMSASVMSMGMTSSLARVASPSAPSYTTSNKISSTNLTGKATGESASMSSTPKPVEMPLGEQPAPDKGHTTAEEVSASSQSEASSETEEGQLDSDDQLSL